MLKTDEKYLWNSYKAPFDCCISLWLCSDIKILECRKVNFSLLFQSVRDGDADWWNGLGLKLLPGGIELKFKRVKEPIVKGKGPKIEKCESMVFDHTPYSLLLCFL